MDDRPILRRRRNDVTPWFRGSLVIEIARDDEVTGIPHETSDPNVLEAIQVQGMVVHGRDRILLAVPIELVDSAIEMPILSGRPERGAKQTADYFLEIGSEAFVV